MSRGEGGGASGRVSRERSGREVAPDRLRARYVNLERANLRALAAHLSTWPPPIDRNRPIAAVRGEGTPCGRGDLYVFRGKNGKLIKVLWHDGLGMSLYAKRLERGRFIWPSAAAGVVSISASQLAYMLDGIDWRNPRHSWRPSAAG
jgi:transposase